MCECVVAYDRFSLTEACRSHAHTVTAEHRLTRPASRLPLLYPARSLNRTPPPPSPPPIQQHHHIVAERASIAYQYKITPTHTHARRCCACEQERSDVFLCVYFLHYMCECARLCEFHENMGYIHSIVYSHMRWLMYRENGWLVPESNRERERASENSLARNTRRMCVYVRRCMCVCVCRSNHYKQNTPSPYVVHIHGGA